MPYHLNEETVFGLLLAVERGVAALNAHRDDNSDYEKEFSLVQDSHDWLVSTISARARRRNMSYMTYVEYLHDRYISGVPLQDTTDS